MKYSTFSCNILTDDYIFDFMIVNTTQHINVKIKISVYLLKQIVIKYLEDHVKSGQCFDVK